MKPTAQLLKAIREGEESVIEEVYRSNRAKFLEWAKKHYPLSEDELLDIFQDAVIVFYQNTVEEKITDLRSSLSTYLFGIAKNLILKKLHKKKRMPLQLDEIPELAVAPQYLAESAVEQEQQRMRTALQQLGQVCRQILEYFYYYGFSLEVIAERLEYKNANTVKAQKHRCMKQLEEQLHK